MAQTFCDLHIHFVFSTKNRQSLIDSTIEARLFAYIGGIANAKKCPLLAAGGMSDHVHLLVGMHSTVAAADLVRDIKANSTSWVRAECEIGRRFSWQNGGGIFGVGHGDHPRVKKYIANQKKHHAAKTFEEEFLEFLKRA